MLGAFLVGRVEGAPGIGPESAAVLQKMAALLAEEVKKNSAQTATLEARSLRAARRDQDLAGAVDDLHETADAEKRKGAWLPSTLRDLFNPSRTNESPFGIWGTLSGTADKFQDRHGNFGTPLFSPHFYMLLNERFLLEVNPEFDPNSRSTRVPVHLTLPVAESLPAKACAPGSSGFHVVPMSSRLTKKSFVSEPGVAVKAPLGDLSQFAPRTRRPPTRTVISGALRLRRFALSMSMYSSDRRLPAA